MFSQQKQTKNSDCQLTGAQEEIHASVDAF
jgi:hypothetical protein